MCAHVLIDCRMYQKWSGRIMGNKLHFLIDGAYECGATDQIMNNRPPTFYVCKSPGWLITNKKDWRNNWTVRNEIQKENQRIMAHIYGATKYHVTLWTKRCSFSARWSHNLCTIIEQGGVKIYKNIQKHFLVWSDLVWSASDHHKMILNTQTYKCTGEWVVSLI